MNVNKELDKMLDQIKGYIQIMSSSHNLDLRKFTADMDVVNTDDGSFSKVRTVFYQEDFTTTNDKLSDKDIFRSVNLLIHQYGLAVPREIISVIGVSRVKDLLNSDENYRYSIQPINQISDTRIIFTDDFKETLKAYIEVSVQKLRKEINDIDQSDDKDDSNKKKMDKYKRFLADVRVNIAQMNIKCRKFEEMYSDDIDTDDYILMSPEFDINIIFQKLGMSTRIINIIDKDKIETIDFV